MIPATVLVSLAQHWRAVGLAALVGMLALMGVAAHHYRSTAVAASAKAAAAEVSVHSIIAESAKNTAAVEKASSDAAVNAAQEDALRNAINAADARTPDDSQVLYDSPAITAALDSLRKPAPGGHTTANPSRAAHVSR